MENIGTEVSLKIRSAVKAKLMELGAFVDDELPDYIMVMVANKRTKQQMDTELQLFLGANTGNFTTWLHTVLQKLEEVTIANHIALSQKVAEDVSKNVESSERPSKSRASAPSDIEEDCQKLKPEKKRKSSDNLSTNKKDVKENKIGSKTLSVKKRTNARSSDPDHCLSGSANVSVGAATMRHRHSQLSDIDTECKSADLKTLSGLSTIRDQASDSHQVAVNMKSVPNTQVSVQKSSPISSSALLQSDEDDDDFLSIRDDAEAMELLDTELPENNKSVRKTQHSTSVSKVKSLRDASANIDEDVNDLEQQRVNLLHNLKLLDKLQKPISENTTQRNRLDPKVHSSSSLDSLGVKTEARPRLTIVDPNELDIVGPTLHEVEMTKQKLADRLGKRPFENRDSDDRLVPIRTLSVKDIKEGVTLGRQTGISSPSEARGGAEVVSDKEAAPKSTRLNVKDRLGARPALGGGGKRTVSLVHDKKDVVKPEVTKLSVMERLGSKVEPKSVREKKMQSHDLEAVRQRVVNRLGNKLTLDCANSSETTKLSVMDRLGKRISSSESERKGLASEEDLSTKMKQTRNVSKETVHSKVQHGAVSKRHSDELLKEDNEVPRKRPLLSRVVAVKHDSSTKMSEEEYDPSNPAVASVVRVQPRPKVPVSMQAPKNLLLKAMAEAQKSVSTVPKRQDSQVKEGLFTRKYRGSAHPMEKINITVMNSNKQEGSSGEELPYEMDKEESQKYRLRRGSLDSLRKPRHKVVEELPKDEQELSDELSMEKRPEPRAKDQSTEEAADDANNDKMICEEVFDEDDFNEEDLIEMTVSNGDSNLGNVSPIINNDESAVETVEYVPTKINSRKRKVARPTSPQFVVTLDGLDPAMFGPRKKATLPREEEPGVTSPVPTLDPLTDDRIHNWLLSLDRAKKEEERTEPSVAVYKKTKVTAPVADSVKPLSLERCKYWPACSKGELCEYLHPSTPCKMFPGCKFGDRCLYIHPNCKFDISCTRRDCPYSHHSGMRGAGSQTSALGSSKSRPHTQPLCKFYPKCSNVNCPFLHPKPCRFGRACTNRECSYFHEEIPTAEKLKWVNSNRF